MSRILSAVPVILALKRYLVWPGVVGTMFMVPNGIAGHERAIRELWERTVGFLQIKT